MGQSSAATALALTRVVIEVVKEPQVSDTRVVSQDE
jgi:hypothetical protein